MHIGTYNVLGLTGYPRDEAVESVGAPGSDSNGRHFAEVFSSLECDVVALQEGVAAKTMQSIAGTMQCYLATFPSPLSWPGHLLSRFPILESRVFSHTSPDEPTPPFSRTAGAALLQLDEELLWVCDVHLHPGDVALREREAGILQQKVTELARETENVVVLGDFNSEVDEAVHLALKSNGFGNAMEERGGGIQATMDTVGIRTSYIDHIYLSPSLRERLTGAHVVRSAGFRHDGPQESGLWMHSDHLPVVAELDWP